MNDGSSLISPFFEKPTDKYRSELYRVGICPDCFEEMSHDSIEPFSNCRCGTCEDTIGPSVLQKLRAENDMLRTLLNTALRSVTTGDIMERHDAAKEIRSELDKL